MLFELFDTTQARLNLLFLAGLSLYITYKYNLTPPDESDAEGSIRPVERFLRNKHFHLLNRTVGALAFLLFGLVLLREFINNHAA